MGESLVSLRSSSRSSISFFSADISFSSEALPSASSPQVTLIIFDVSREIQASTLEWTTQKFLHPGDTLTLVGILHEILTPMGYKSKVDFDSFNGVNSKSLEKEAAKAVEYYKIKFLEHQLLCNQKKIKFDVQVATGNSLDVTAVREAKRLGASYVILERNLKRHSRSIVDQLSCNVILLDRNKEGKVMKTSGGMLLYPSHALDGYPGMGKEEECPVCQNETPPFHSMATGSFSYAELEDATENFSPSRLLAEGGYGKVYRGMLKDGRHIAVKQNKSDSAQGAKEFQAEIETLRGVQHKNIVNLYGYCDEGGRRMLVYEYICNKSLDLHLSDQQKVLPWSARFSIALGAARGLRYLHEGIRTGSIIHRDIRPHNILLTHSFTPKVGDFGLAKWTREDAAVQTRLAGTIGYMAPEYIIHAEVTSKIDVYSFGVVLLELVTGRRAVNPKLAAPEKSLTEWARPMLQTRNAEALIDKRLGEDFDAYELQCMIHAAAFCLQQEPSQRAKMSQIVRILEAAQALDFFI